MSLNHIPAAAVLAAAALGRVDTKDELEATWISSGCDNFRGAARTYLLRIYQQVCSRIDRNDVNLRLARAI